MTRYTLEIHGGAGYGRKSIEASGAEEAIAKYWAGLSQFSIPSATRVYLSPGKYALFDEQAIVNIVAAAEGRRAYDVTDLMD